MSRRNIIIGLILFLVLAQLKRIDKSQPPTDPAKDFLTLTNAPAEMQDLFQAACYDCHSHQSEYPWYTNVAPLSWWIGGHIKGARRVCNFSTWGDLDASKKRNKLEDIVEVLETGRMPAKSFKLLHPEAKLTDDQVTKMVDWTKSQIK